MGIVDIKDELNERRQEIFEAWNRVLPMGELLSDRWEKAKFAGAKVNTSIYDSAIILGEVKIGKHVWIGPWTLLDGTAGLEIGDYCNISAGVQIYSHDTVLSALSAGKEKFSYDKTKIGDCCYISPMCIISKGVEIGEKCVIAANSFVNKSFPSGSIIAGTPAKKIGTVKSNEDGTLALVYDS